MPVDKGNPKIKALDIAVAQLEKQYGPADAIYDRD